MRQFQAAMAAGIAFVAAYVVSVFVSFGNSPDIKSKDSDAVAAAKYVAKLSDSGNRAGILVAAYLMIVAAVLFVWFMHGLASRLRTQASGRLVFGLGVLGAAMLAGGAMTSAVTAGAVSFGNEPVPRSGDTIRVVMDLTFPFWFVAFGLTLAAILIAVALGSADVWPAWLRGVAWLGVLGAIFGVIFIPMVLPLLWILAASIVGLTTANRPAPAPQPAAG